VKIGDKIISGMVIGIIEAMKTMNEIESEIDGEIIEILTENGSPVEYGQPLFRVV
jgi:acetyl-CoA carboxylase biotin carboxyl carrier protein